MRTRDLPVWVDNPPESAEEQVLLLETHLDRVTESGPVGECLRALFNNLKRTYAEVLQKVKNNEPIAFFKPSYEQALLLNAWTWGITFPICFASNRIGKTVAGVINALLWIFPNNPQWFMFKPRIDHLGRVVAVLPRPPLPEILNLQQFYRDNPHLVGNPYLQPYEGNNADLFKTVQRTLATLQSCWPLPPIQRGGTFWLGAPDNPFHVDIIMPRWRDWLPRASILKDNFSDRFFIISTASSTNPKATAHKILCKSYESEDTKWSGDAVQGIILTEGFDQATLDEIKQRIVNDGFMWWDYTPAEARNTGKKVALAYKVYKKEEELPLLNFVYLKFRVADAPDHIIPKEKREDMIRMWSGRDQGKARIEGDFFASSGLVLSKLNKEFHCLPWSFEELQARFPDGRLYRSIDPGLDHPTACCWLYLSYNNIWFVYRFYSERGKTISERCQDIIRLSNNQRRKSVRHSRVFWQEIHTSPKSEVFSSTIADYHVFKEDELTGQNYANNYAIEGLPLSESVHMGPEDRAKLVDNLLDPQGFPYLAHPISEKPPGCRLFFLINEHGVAKALNKMEELFWERYKAGDLKGEPKDKVPLHGDDELDALSQPVCGGYVWTHYIPRRVEPSETEPEIILSPHRPPPKVEPELIIPGRFI